MYRNPKTLQENEILNCKSICPCEELGITITHTDIMKKNKVTENTWIVGLNLRALFSKIFKAIRFLLGWPWIH